MERKLVTLRTINSSFKMKTKPRNLDQVIQHHVIVNIRSAMGPDNIQIYIPDGSWVTNASALITGLYRNLYIFDSKRHEQKAMDLIRNIKRQKLYI